MCYFHFTILLFFWVFVFSGYESVAQNSPGAIIGVLKDSTGEGILGASVYLEGTAMGSATEYTGEYQIQGVPAGNYNIIFSAEGYGVDTVKVTVVSGEMLSLDHSMNLQTNKLLEVVVVGVKDRSTETALVTEIQKSSQVVSGISNQQIARGQDRNAAQVLRRIPGVTLVDNRFIMVRGLSERYNTVWLNNATAPSSEPDKKAFSFDIIPSQLIERILIYKTAAPELPGDFAGGMAKVYTRTALPKRVFQMQWQESFRPGSTFGTMNKTPGSATDFLGFDSGIRELPKGTPQYVNRNAPNSDQVSQSFKNTWGLKNRTALPDLRLNVFYSNRFKVGKRSFGSATNVNYANLNTIFKIHRQDWDSTAVERDLSDVQSTNIARVGVIENLDMRFSPVFNLKWKHMFSQIGQEQNTYRVSNLPQAPNQKAYALLYTARTIYSTQLNGTCEWEKPKLNWDFTAGYSYSSRNMPDFRRIKYTKQQTAPDSLYKVSVEPGTVDPVNGGGRFYSKLHENIFSFNHTLDKTWKNDNVQTQILVGNFVEYKFRHFSARTLGYVIPPGQKADSLTRLPLGHIFASQNIAIPGGFKVDEITSPSDAYTAQNFLVATFAALDIKVKKLLSLHGGFRYERNVMSLQSYLNLEPISPSITTNFLLPSLNVALHFSKKSLLRVAYGRTLNRPEFREWSPFFFYDFQFNAATYGSLFPTPLEPHGTILKVATIDNYDLRYEYYTKNGGMLHIGIFYKRFKNPIQRVVLAVTNDSRLFSFANANSAYSKGIEVDLRQNLGQVFQSSPESILSKMILVGNASLIKSQLTINHTINQESKVALQGQSPYVVNGGLFYQDDSAGFQFSILYNVFGPRVYLFGTKDYPSYGQLAINMLDINIVKNITKRWAINVGVQNLLNQPVWIVQDTNNNGHFERHGADETIMKYRRGPYYTVGVRLSL